MLRWRWDWLGCLVLSSTLLSRLVCCLVTTWYCCLQILFGADADIINHVLFFGFSQYCLYGINAAINSKYSFVFPWKVRFCNIVNLNARWNYQVKGIPRVKSLRSWLLSVLFLDGVFERFSDSDITVGYSFIDETSNRWKGKKHQGFVGQSVKVEF